MHRLDSGPLAVEDCLQEMAEGMRLFYTDEAGVRSKRPSRHREANAPAERTKGKEGREVRVAEIWRYPVKSMAGERLDEAAVGPLGIEGDRWVHVRDARGRIITARTHPRLLGHRATLDGSGQPLIDGRPWTDSSVQQEIVDIVGPGARLIADASSERFDILPLLIATDGAIRAFAEDGRRLRPNLVIGGVDGLDERSWPGRGLRVGSVRIGIRDLRDRCVMTTYDPDTFEQASRTLGS